MSLFHTKQIRRRRQPTPNIREQINAALDNMPITQNDIYVIDDQLTAAVREENAALQTEMPPNERPRMSITGASYLAASTKEKIAAAKARMAQVSAGTDVALQKLNGAASRAELVAKTIEAEADALDAELGQFTNGSPD